MALPRIETDLSSPVLNRVAPEDRAFHDWYRFVLSFPPHLVRTYFDRFGLGADSVVLDPFCGTGTTLVEAKKWGMESVGIEANPMAALASRVKTDWGIEPTVLEAAAEQVAAKARHLGPEFSACPSKHEGEVREQLLLSGLMDLDADQRQLLLTGSISERPLHRSLAVLNAIRECDPRLQEHLRLALAWALVNVAGNLRFGPEVGITPPKWDVDVVGAWLGRVKLMETDLDAAGRPGVKSTVWQADSRSPVMGMPAESIDAIFTSPPYPNEKDYTRTTRLESVVLGLVRNKAELRALKQGLVRSNTRNVYVGDTDDLHVADNPEVQEIAEQIERRRLELGKDSGFERLYHRVTRLYFGGMAAHLEEMKRILRPGALLGYVVGDQASYLRVMIRTGNLLAQIAERRGYVVESIDLFRTRYATATREQLREEVVVLRWPGA